MNKRQWLGDRVQRVKFIALINLFLIISILVSGVGNASNDKSPSGANTAEAIADSQQPVNDASQSNENGADSKITEFLEETAAPDDNSDTSSATNSNNVKAESSSEVDPGSQEDLMSTLSGDEGDVLTPSQNMTEADLASNGIMVSVGGNTGAATTSIPVIVPPGRKGIQPNISLTYNSNARNGWLGVGWSLDMGAIQRNTKRSVNYTSNDYVAVVNGSTSELAPRGDWGANYYGANIEGAFLKYLKLSDTMGWQVTAKDGMKYYYGTRSDGSSRQDNVHGVFKWRLDRVEDTNGNYMEITYRKDLEGELYLDEIKYTGNTTTGFLPNNSIKFLPDAEQRTDIQTMYTTHSAVKTVERLGSIEIYGNSQLVRKYALDYVYSTSGSNRSLLKAVTLYSQDESQSLTIDLEQYGLAFNIARGVGANFPTAYGSGWDNRNTKPVFTADVDGDGMDEIVAFNSDGVYVSKLECGSFYPPQKWVDAYGTNSGWTNIDTYPRYMADVNGDGKADVVGFFTNGVNVSLSTGSSFTTPQLWVAAYGTNNGWTNTNTHPRYMADVNGDGMADVIGFFTNGVNVSLSTGSLFTTPELWVAAYGTNNGWTNNSTHLRYMADVNGDGKADVVGFNSDGVYVSLAQGNNTFSGAVRWVTGYGTNDGWTDNDPYDDQNPRYMADMNGDGLADIIGFNAKGAGGASEGSVYVSLSTGSEISGFKAPELWASNLNNAASKNNNQMTDVDGDGRADFIQMGWDDNQKVYVSLSRGDSLAPRRLWFNSPNVGPISLHMVELNGDGRADALYFDNYGEKIYLSRNEPVDLLQSIKTYTGGRTTINYKPSPTYANEYLPFAVQTVSSVEVDDDNNVNTPQSVTSYNYAGGFFDVIDREFRGFAGVTKTEPSGTNTTTEFYTDHQNNYYKGLPKEQTVSDSLGNIYTRAVYTYDVDMPYAGVDFPYLIRKDDYIFDGNTTDKNATSSARHIASEFWYDSYGNITIKYLHGDENISGDERYEYAYYAPYDMVNWIVSLPKSTYIVDNNGYLVAQKWFIYYPNTANLYKVEAWNNDGSDPVTTYTYDSYGNVKTILDPRNNLTKITYDTTSYTYPWKMENALGHVIERTYDYRYGKVITEKDPDQNQTAYQYDGFGRSKKIIKPAPYGITEYFYNNFGEPFIQHIREEAQDQAGALMHWKETYFDGLGRTTTERSGGPGAAPVIAVDTAYDLQGSIATRSYPYYEGSQAYDVSYSYDPVNRLEQTNYPDGTSTVINYDRGRISYVDANRHLKVAEKDAYGRIVAIEEYTGNGTPDPYTLYAETLYWYDLLNNLEYVRDAQGNETYITYDSLSRKVSISDPDMGLWEYDYDANGNLISQTDQMERTILFQYDKLNRVTLKDYPDGTDITYSYDEAFSTNAKGRMTTVSDSSGTTAFFYDAMGQISRSVKTLSIDSSTYTTQTQYDPLGRVKKIIYPDNAEVDYTYDDNGNIKDIKSGASSYVTYNSYTALGKPLLVTFNNGVTTQYQYYPENNRLKKIYTANGPTNLMNLEYFYDNAGNITRLSDYHDSDKTRTYQYDDVDRLIEADSPSYEGKLIYQYDKIGNMTYNCKFGHYYYEDANHVHAVTKVVDSNGTIVTSYIYDGNGNMTSGAGRTLTYDYDNRPTSITYNGNTVVNVYDVNGNRVHKMLSSPMADITTYVGQLYECSSGTGGCTKYIFAGEQRVASIKTLGGDNDTYYYHTDHLLSSSIITAGDDVEENLAGDKLEDIHYYPFGEIHTNSGSVSVRHKFAGHEFDAETGLIYMGARYYDPKLARFITADPVVPTRIDQHNFRDFKLSQAKDLTNPQKLNRYSYCGNNPVLLRDPFGLDWVSDVSTGLGIASAVTNTVGLVYSPAKPIGWAITGGTVAFVTWANQSNRMSNAEAGRNYALAAADAIGTGLDARGLINIGNLVTIISRALGIANTGYDAAKAAGNETSPTATTGTSSKNNQPPVEKPPSNPNAAVNTVLPSTKSSGSENTGGGTTTDVQQSPESSSSGSGYTSPETTGHSTTGHTSSPSGVNSPSQSAPTYAPSSPYNGNTDASGGLWC